MTDAGLELTDGGGGVTARPVQQRHNPFIRRPRPTNLYCLENSYISFGCKDCDALFGDFFVREAIIDSYNGDNVIDRFSFKTDAAKVFKQDIPHWCHPGDNDFCD